MICYDSMYYYALGIPCNVLLVYTVFQFKVMLQS